MILSSLMEDIPLIIKFMAFIEINDVDIKGVTCAVPKQIKVV